MDRVKNLGKVYKSSKEAVFIDVPLSDLPKALRAVRERTARVSAITGYDSGKDIELIYHFPAGRRIINLKVRLRRDKPSIETITNLFPGAELFERELHDLLGVFVDGHPNLKRILLDKTSPKAPLRRKGGML